jgi:hypothetical protein
VTSAATIASTLARGGQTVTIAGTQPVARATSTSTETGAAYAETGSAVLLPLNPYKAQQNSDIIAGDEQMLLSALVAKPPLGSVITLADGTTKYTLIAVDPLHPAGDELLWDCVVRGH